MSPAPRNKRALWIFIGVIAAVACIVFLIPPSRMTDPAVKLLSSMIWPPALLLLVILFRDPIEMLVSEITKRIRRGGGLKVANVFELEAETLSEHAARIPSPSTDEPITLGNVALLHTSFIPKTRAPIEDGRTYFQIEMIVIAPDAVMERIDSVTYRFDDVYPPKSREQIKYDSRDRFKVKELANGTSIVRAEIRFRDQEPPLHLNRFIDLRADGPRI